MKTYRRDKNREATIRRLIPDEIPSTPQAMLVKHGAIAFNVQAPWPRA